MTNHNYVTLIILITMITSLTLVMSFGLIIWLTMIMSLIIIISLTMTVVLPKIMSIAMTMFQTMIIPHHKQWPCHQQYITSLTMTMPQNYDPITAL